MNQFFTKKIDWRESPRLWAPVAWLAAIMWPPAVFGLIVLPPTKAEGRLVLMAVIAAAIGVAAIMQLLQWERARDGAPRTRLGVIARYLFFGFVYTVLVTVLGVFLQSAFALFGPHGFDQNLAETNSTLLIGLLQLALAAIFGISWFLWAGIAVCLIAFCPRAESVRPRSFVLSGGLTDSE